VREPVFSLEGPARIGLISDTHVFPNGSRQISPHVFAAFSRMRPGLIVHAGDVATQSVIDDLTGIAPVLAVRGNNDHGSFGAGLPMVATITCLGRTIRVVHGHGGRSAKAVAAELATGADCVIYGHSHIPDVRKVGEALVVNPGSAADRRWHPHFGIGYLDVTESGFRPQLLLWADPIELDRMKIEPRAEP
jgi:putative phosphoesterase